MPKTSRPTAPSRKRSPAPRRKPVPPHEPLLAFAALARSERLRWYLFGAQAVALYGVQRTSADLDIAIELGDRPLRALIRTLVRAGFRPRFDDDAFIAATRVLPVVHRASSWPIDLVLTGPGLEEAFFVRARVHRIGRTSIRALCPEDLIVTKLLAQRPKDREDVRALVRAVRDLDLELIDATLRELEAALDQADLRPLFARLIESALADG